MSDKTETHTAERLAVICGNGLLPVEVIAAAGEAGLLPLAVGIKGEADKAIEDGSPALWFDWGEIGKLAKALKRNGVRDVVLIGGITQRPDFKSILGDLGTMCRLPRILEALRKGDDGLLKAVIALFEEEGFRVIGAHEIAPSLLATPGPVGRHAPDENARRDLEIAKIAARTLGKLDIGQAAVAVNGHVIAAEAAEGTDGMLRRCLDLKHVGRVRWKGQAGVLVKCVKPGQDLRVDLPSVGPNTVQHAAELGLAGIVVDAGRVLMASRAETIEIADRHGLFIYGFDERETDDVGARDE
ncbi:UDP-2,3-diacylglucosamine diphosphatase LpxI [Breoghania sp.]|uniref:LpxI family protein n=1 Tax=Breoghania sp. TaxID=2065378 RepID=UPI002620D043|nr:UDP-2,3-diacylglucosamine diphosphatase LpxI [Breoghania sp.]MDJ0929676.1 UDP-2,3-diacylglucosamine diphosphatase LpxI [Breoghania sp.]